jgi:hypothetical protein
MKKLLATTAIALMASGPLLAQQATTETTPPAAAQTQDGMAMADGGLFLPMGQAGNMHASELIGMPIHSSEADYATYGADPVAMADVSEWDAIGEVNDIIITADGQAQAILVDIGGFLGMGGHTVALDMSQVHFLRDESGAPFVAVNSTREALEQAPVFERHDEMAAAAPADPATMPQSTETAAPMDMTRPAFTREGYQDVDYAALTAEDLQGAPIYDANDDNIGDVSELILSDGGQIDQVVVDVGGFLGIGVHSVALDFDELQILRNADGTDLRVYLDQTRETLEQRPAYEG